MIVSVRLVDGDRSMSLFVLDEFRQDLIFQGLDVSSAVVRESVQDRPDDDGTDDETEFHGASAVSLSVKVFDGGQAALVDQLRTFLRPSIRPYLCVVDDEWAGERRIRLRAEQSTSPMLTFPDRHVSRTVQAQWKAPDGVWVATDSVQLTLLGAGGASVGRSYQAAYPRTYVATQGLGQLNHTYGGTDAAHQVIRMYGPCAGPRYTNDDTGETIAFREDLVLPTGDYVEVDTRAGTAYYLSDRSAPVLDKLDFGLSSWWRLNPGVNRVRYHPTSQVDAGCQAVVTYQPVFLT